MKELLNLAIDSAKEAGKHLLNNFGKINTIESKGDRNLATNLDKEAEKIIIDYIKRKFPEHGVLAEEGGSFNLDKDYIWIIDPLDGTHNFIRNIDIFGVSIGVVYKDEFVIGVIYMPKDDELYFAEKNNGAYKNSKKISVSNKTNLKECSISFDSSIRYSPDIMLSALNRFSKEVFNIRMFGSSARVLSYVAEGKLDFAIEFFDRPWDFAGGVCLIEEAGGRFSNLLGEKITYRTIGYIASNSSAYKTVSEILKDLLLKENYSLHYYKK